MRRRRILRHLDRPELSDEQWERLRPLLPLQKPRAGRPANDHRTVREGILWVLRTGAPWHDQPSGDKFDRATYRESNVVERLINRLKWWR